MIPKVANQTPRLTRKTVRRAIENILLYVLMFISMGAIIFLSMVLIAGDPKIKELNAQSIMAEFYLSCVGILAASGLGAYYLLGTHSCRFRRLMIIVAYAVDLWAISNLTNVAKILLGPLY